MRQYLQIKNLRELDVKIFLDDNLVYSGNVSSAPDNIKQMYYNEIKIKQSMPIELYIYTKNEEE